MANRGIGGKELLGGTGEKRYIIGKGK